MKVKTSSWHYRLWRAGRESSRSQPRDLCRYFWHLFLVKILLPLALVGFALLGLGALALAIWGNPAETGIIIGGLALIVIVVLAVALAGRKYSQRPMKSKKKVEVEKEPSVLLQYLSARKRKLCPLIEVVREEDV